MKRRPSFSERGTVGGRVHTPRDEQDNAGIRVPPPLIYLAPLVSGLLLDTRYHVPFLPRGIARHLGWTLLSGSVVLAGWFLRTMRSADTSIRTDQPVSSLVPGGPFRYTRNPGYLSLAMIYAGIAVRRNALWAMLLLPAVLLMFVSVIVAHETTHVHRS